MRTTFVALTFVLAMSSAGCTKKAEGQTVAVVNGNEITTAQLNAEIAAAHVPAGVDGALARKELLQKMIDRTLLAQEARKEGIDTSPEFLQRERSLTEGLLISMLADRQTGAAQLPSEPDVTAFQANHPQMFAQHEIWSLDQLRFKMPSAASVKSQIANTKSLQDLAKVLAANNIVATPGKNRIDTASVPDAIYTKISKLASGEPFIVPLGTDAVASAIVTRNPQPITGDEAKPVAVEEMKKQQTMKLLQDRVKDLRQTAKIEYKAGFGPPSK